MSQDNERDESEFLGFLGVGLDNKDDHKRLTRTKHFFLVGGSAETHESMQGTAIRFNEALDRTHKSLRETSPKEAIDLLREAMGL